MRIIKVIILICLIQSYSCITIPKTFNYIYQDKRDGIYEIKNKDKKICEFNIKNELLNGDVFLYKVNGSIKYTL